MSLFEARLTELNLALDSPATGLDGGLRSTLKSKVANIKAVHDAMYDHIVTIVTNSHQYSDKSAFDTVWINMVDTARKRVADLFTPDAATAQMSVTFRKYWEEVKVQEDQCLEWVKMPDWRNHFFQIVQHRAQMLTLLVEMDRKWSRNLSDKDSLTPYEKKAIDLMAESVKRAIANATTFKQQILGFIDTTKSSVSSEGARAAASIGEAIAKDYKTAGITIIVTAVGAALGGVSGVITAQLLVLAQDRVRKYLEAEKEEARAFKQATEEYQRRMIDTGYVIGMFRTNRTLVLDYLAKQSTSKIADARTAADEVLNKRAATIKSPRFTDGMHNDAQTFAKRLSEHVGKIHAQCVEVEERFITKFRGIFESSLSDTTIESLTSIKMFESYLASNLYSLDTKASSKELADLKMNLEAEFGKMIDNPISFAQLPEEARLALLDKSKEFRAALQKAFDDSVKTYVEVYIRSKGELEAIVLATPRAVSRTPLLTAMR